MKIVGIKFSGLALVIIALVVITGCNQTSGTRTEDTTLATTSTPSITQDSSRNFSPIEKLSTTLFELPKYTLTNLEQKQTESSWEISGTIEQREPKWQGLIIGSEFYSTTKSGDMVKHAGGISIIFCNHEGRDIAYLGTDTVYVDNDIDTWSFMLKISSDENLPDYTYLWKPSMGDCLSLEAFQQEAQISQMMVSLDDDEEPVQYGDNQYMAQFEVDLSNSPSYQPPINSTPISNLVPPKFVVTEINILRGNSLSITGKLKQTEPTWQGLTESESIRVGSVDVYFCKPDGSPIIDYHGSELSGFATYTLEPEVIVESGTFSIELSEGKYGPNFREGAFQNMSFSDFIQTAVIYKVVVLTNQVQIEGNYVSQFEADLRNAIVEDKATQ